MSTVNMSPEQEKLLDNAAYLLLARERTAHILSRGPNGRKAEIRYRFGNGGPMEGAEVAIDMMVAEMIGEAVDLGRRVK